MTWDVAITRKSYNAEQKSRSKSGWKPRGHCRRSKSCFRYIQVEGLLDDEDFKMKVSRSEMEELCEDMFNRVTKPIDDALKASEITLVSKDAGRTDG